MSDDLYDPDAIQLESSLGYYLTKARNVLMDRMDRALAPLDLTSQQIGVVLLLANGRARTSQELSRALAYDSGSMTRMLDRLEKKGLIVRSRSADDRRVVCLALTELGLAASKKLPRLGAAVLNEQLRGFSADELATLTSLLGRFIANGPDGAGLSCLSDEAAPSKTQPLDDRYTTGN
ncbi:MarR family transcriptional regulator [Trinickia terrae]|uniref:MarR family transcriptional regulator n=1 Tax=Trinickia terrae TaxID=2571161 RepID=A0A4U1HTP4_9BURK|nr:MarR family transcriptional regulator [Trinickia terrae]TKC83508.1 MarR family transcriptional regulator [Trinickia terrae]